LVLEGNDWLALTQEETLDSELPICDPHHHFWEYRPEPPSYQRYLLEELAEDINLPCSDLQHNSPLCSLVYCIRYTVQTLDEKNDIHRSTFT